MTIRQRLKVLKNELHALLLASGFQRRANDDEEYEKNINDESSIVFFLGTSRRAGAVRIDPVVALYNRKLGSMLDPKGLEFSEWGRVCHIFLSVLSDAAVWHLDLDADEGDILLIAKDIEEVLLREVMPLFSRWDRLETVRVLYYQDREQTKSVPIAIILSDQKIRAMDNYFGVQI